MNSQDKSHTPKGVSAHKPASIPHKIPSNCTKSCEKYDKNPMEHSTCMKHCAEKNKKS